MVSILLGRKVMYLFLHSLCRFKNTNFYRMYTMILCHLWYECKMVLKEVHFGQPSQYARKACVFSGLVMKVLHTSGWHAVDDENTFSTADVTNGTAQIHFLTTGKCTHCFWKLFTRLYKTLNSTSKSQLFKISHTFSQSHWASKNFTHLVQSWFRHCNLIQTNSRNLSLMPMMLIYWEEVYIL